jgi:hypothetical protein
MSRFLAGVCEELPQFAPEQIEAAIPVVKGGRFLPRPKLIERLREHLEPTPAEAEAKPAHTSSDSEIAELTKELCDWRIHRNQAETQEFIYFSSYADVLYAWSDLYRQQKATIESLLDYIASVPLQNESKAA